MKCINCEKIELTGKKRFCSDKCRKAFSRRTKKGDEVGQIKADKPNRTFDFELTRTDKLFEEYSPGYYDFGLGVHSKTCWVCKKPFKTRLELLKTCSPKHYQEMIDSLVV